MTFFKSFESFSHILLFDFLRYFITACSAYLFFWVLFLKQWSHRIIQNRFPKLSRMWFEFKYSMSTVLIFALIGYMLTEMTQTGYTKIYSDFATYGWLWFFSSIFTMIILHDTYFYWVHRLMHHPKIYRHIRLVHHRSTNPSPWAAYSFHPLEAVIEAGFLPIIAFMIPIHHTALFMFLIYMIIRNVQGHLGIEFLPNKFLKLRLINLHTTTTHHDLHHKHFNSNYGLYFTWWDKWMGTEDKSYNQTFNEVTKRRNANVDIPKSSLFKRMQKFLKVAAVVTIFLGSFNNEISGQSPVGIWQTIDDKDNKPRSLVEIKEENGKLMGYVRNIFPRDSEPNDPVCSKCAGKRNDEPVKGMNIIWDLVKTKSSWENGQILDPANGKIYEATIWLEDANTLKVRGYLWIFYRTQTWYRVK